MVWPKLGTAFAVQATGAAGKMTFRNVAVNVVRRGREIFEGIFQKNTPRTRDFGRHEAEAFTKPIQSSNKGWSSQSGFLGKSSWVQSLVRYSSQTLAGELRRRAAYQFQSGSAALYGRALGISRRVPLYAFVGLNMGVATANRASQKTEIGQGFDKVCEHIKTMFQPTRISEDELGPDSEVGAQVEDYVFGPMIAKGCNAAVFQAKRKTVDAQELPWLPASEENVDLEVILENEEELESRSDTTSECPDSFVVIPEDEQTGSDIISWTGSDIISWTGSDITVISEESSESTPEFREEKSCSSTDVQQEADLDYDLAVKMMFNYDAGSAAHAILNTMQNEVVPAKMADTNSQMDQWENGNHAKKKRLAPHPNIVDMWGVFVDDVPNLPESMTEYPSALPERLNPDGFGRNRTMFLVMKKYTCTLREYLQQHTPSVREGTMLLAQLVEAVAYLTKEGVAHRDIKSDNILLDLDVDGECPQLVLSDFGCCLAEEGLDLKVPYFNGEVNKGGNGSLMAPEIARATPGYKQYLNYQKSDVWACGAVAYEIFGLPNPFYRSAQGHRLDSRSYLDDDLPDLPDLMPVSLQKIIKSSLCTEPSQRPDASMVSNLLNIFLWQPEEWTLPPCKVKVMRWLLTFSAGVLCQRAVPSNLAEQRLKMSFLAGLDLDVLLHAMHTLWSDMEEGLTD